MSAMTTEELSELRRSARGTLARFWGSALAADSADVNQALERVWTAAADLGWTTLGQHSQLDALMVLVNELGRVGCPLPLVDCFIVTGLLGADAAVVAGIEDGTVRPVVAVVTGDGTDGREDGVIDAVEATPAATHLLVADVGAGRCSWHALESSGVHPTTGLARPPWACVRPHEPEHIREIGGEVRDAALLLRLGLAVRALGAASRSHELAVTHATERRQFGVTIGAFQAVSHRLADSEIELTAGRMLIAQAAQMWSEARTGWRLQVLVAVAQLITAAPCVQRRAHQTLGATGYFEEHEGPWLFRRVHADVAGAGSLAPVTGDVVDRLLDHGERLPLPCVTETAQQMRAEVLAVFDPSRAVAADRGTTTPGRPDTRVVEVFTERGWLAATWPSEDGGQGMNSAEMLAFTEALGYADVPVGGLMMGVHSVAPIILRYGSDAMKRQVLPGLARGEVIVGLGYSEPEAGSDLASLNTRATRVDGGWRLTGQKLWGTNVHVADFILVAARTDPDARPRHAGISLFLVRSGRPGLTVHPHRSLAGEISCTTFWDDVFVDDDELIGPQNGGWAVLADALRRERELIGAGVGRSLRQLDDLIDHVSRSKEARHRDHASSARALLDDLAVRVQTARTVLLGVDVLADPVRSAPPLAPIIKILTSELSVRSGEVTLSLLGTRALLGPESPGHVGAGRSERNLRQALMYVIAGGTNDIQRNLIARHLGMPRWQDQVPRRGHAVEG